MRQLSVDMFSTVDGYGGSSRSRCRMVLEIGERVRGAVGGKLAVGLRLSVEERLANGAGITEEELEARGERLRDWQEQTCSWAHIAGRFANALQLSDSHEAHE